MKKWLIIAACVFVVLFVVFGMWGAHVAKRMIEERRHNIAGLALEIGGYEVSLIGASLKLKDIKIYPSGQEEEKYILASAEGLSISVALLDLLKGTLHAKEIVLKSPKISYVITGKKASNWDALNLGGAVGKTEEKKVEESADSWPIIIDDVKIEDGDVAYRDQTKGQHLQLKGVDISVEDIKAAKNPDDLPTSFELKAQIGDVGGMMSVKGKADALGEGISFDLDGNLSSTPITAFSSFYAGSVPFVITGGTIAVKSKAVAKKNILTSSHHATIFGLTTGGNVKGEMINRYVLSQSGPIGVDASVNGDLSTGNLSVSSAIAKNFTDEILRRSAGSSPEMAVDVIKKAAPTNMAPVKKSLKGLFKKR